LLDPGPRARDHHRREPQRLPGHQGGDRVPRDHHHADQPGSGRHVQGGRPEGVLQMSAVLDNPPVAIAHESPGLWTLGWRRLRQDKVGMLALVVVVIFLAMMVLSFFGVIAGDWNKEKGGSYANPEFMAGAENL